MFTCIFYLWFCIAFNLPVPFNETGTKNFPLMQTTASKEEIFARQVFDCLKKNDKNGFLALYPKSSEYKALLQKMAALKHDGLTQAQADEMVAAQQKEGAQYGSDEFAGLQREAKAAGLIWSKMVYTGFTFETGASPIGNRYLQGDVWLKSGKTEYVIEKIEAIETTGGWRLQNIASIRKLDTKD